LLNRKLCYRCNSRILAFSHAILSICLYWLLNRASNLSQLVTRRWSRERKSVFPSSLLESSVYSSWLCSPVTLKSSQSLLKILMCTFEMSIDLFLNVGVDARIVPTIAPTY
jgi:hypothetical protein